MAPNFNLDFDKRTYVYWDDFALVHNLRNFYIPCNVSEIILIL